jgi:glycosyltransferase involved in cell wall biosynthesis
LNQTYKGSLELVIVDNNEIPFKFSVQMPATVEDRIAVKYIKAPRSKAVGFYRNLGTEQASGEICYTVDEDDWSHPDRVRSQVARLQESGKAVTGWHNILYFNEDDGRTYKYFYEADPNRNHPPYAMGTSQCYLKSWWEQHKFPETGVEDQHFSNEALHAKQLDSCDAGQLCVARAHRDSKCHPQFVGKQFPAVSHDVLPKEFWDAL